MLWHVCSILWMHAHCFWKISNFCGVCHLWFLYSSRKLKFLPSKTSSEWLQIYKRAQSLATFSFTSRESELLMWPRVCMSCIARLFSTSLRPYCHCNDVMREDSFCLGMPGYYVSEERDSMWSFISLDGMILDNSLQIGIWYSLSNPWNHYEMAFSHDIFYNFYLIWYLLLRFLHSNPSFCLSLSSGVLSFPVPGLNEYSLVCLFMIAMLQMRTCFVGQGFNLQEISPFHSFHHLVLLCRWKSWVPFREWQWTLLSTAQPLIQMNLFPTYA